MIITNAAEERIKTLLGKGKEYFRVRVAGGGCSGFQYQFLLDDIVTPDDKILKQGEAQLVIDDVSLSMISGSQLDYSEELGSSSFVIRNPNATSGCGCGNSFSI